VALGSDFDGIEVGPEGLETAAELPNLRRALQAAGFTAPEVAAVLGGNFLRSPSPLSVRERAEAGAGLEALGGFGNLLRTAPSAPPIGSVAPTRRLAVSCTPKRSARHDANRRYSCGYGE
jgi:hypothetical protein